MDYKKLYEDIEKYVTSLFKTIPHPSLIFHNLEHTRNVVRHTEEISSHYPVSDLDKLILFTAAWFHDCGHLYTTPDKHEPKSCEIMKGFMVNFINDEAIISKISNCIMATKFPRHPFDLLEDIICDADTYHFGTSEFKVTNKKVFEELQLTVHSIDKKTFKEGTIKMLSGHQFYTSYCSDLLNNGKAENLRQLMEQS